MKMSGRGSFPVKLYYRCEKQNLLCHLSQNITLLLIYFQLFKNGEAIRRLQTIQKEAVSPGWPVGWSLFHLGLPHLGPAFS